MKEYNPKNILQRGKLETSSGFTDRLLHKIETKPAEKTSVFWSYRSILVSVTLSMLAIIYLLVSCFDGATGLLNSMRMFKIPVVLVVSFFFLFTLNHIFTLNHSQKKLSS